MPFRLNEHRAKIQFITSAAMPNRIYKACLKTDTVSNTRYIQEAVCAALSRDLDIPLDDLLAELPEPRSNAARMIERNGHKVPAQVRPVEEVR